MPTFYAFFKCSLYNNIHKPGKLANGADFYCFKKEIEPKWEDPVCANGGKWTMTFQKSKSDNPWLYTVLAFLFFSFILRVLLSHATGLTSLFICKIVASNDWRTV